MITFALHLIWKLGYVRDKTDFVTTLHFLNLATYFVTISWIAERIYRHYQEQNQKPIEPETPDPSVKWSHIMLPSSQNITESFKWIIEQIEFNQNSPRFIFIRHKINVHLRIKQINLIVVIFLLNQ